jgi:hypothetical protein
LFAHQDASDSKHGTEKHIQQKSGYETVKPGVDILSVIAPLAASGMLLVAVLIAFKRNPKTRPADKSQPNSQEILKQEYERGRKEEREYTLKLKQGWEDAAYKDPPFTMPEEIAFRGKVRADYGNLTYPQKLALARIATYPGNTDYTLVEWLGQKGFGQPIRETILSPLLMSPLLDADGQGRLDLSPSKRELIAALLRQDGMMPRPFSTSEAL